CVTIVLDADVLRLWPVVVNDWPFDSGLLSSVSRWSVAARDLHSFPTRRSSDLCSPGRSAQPTRCRPSSILSAASSGRSACRRWRSEEHTSELQSRENLVCRLLLEKKKSATNNSASAALALNAAAGSSERADRLS